MNKTDHFSVKNQIIDKRIDIDEKVTGIAIYDTTNKYAWPVVSVVLSEFNIDPKIDFEYLWKYAKDNFLPDDYDTFISYLLNWHVLVYSL